MCRYTEKEVATAIVTLKLKRGSANIYLIKIELCIHLLPISFINVVGIVVILYYTKNFRKTKVTVEIIRFVNGGIY